jgi:hypothetical protein
MNWDGGVWILQQQAISVVYENLRIDTPVPGRVEDQVIVEIKSIDLIAPVLAC